MHPTNLSLVYPVVFYTLCLSVLSLRALTSNDQEPWPTEFLPQIKRQNGYVKNPVFLSAPSNLLDSALLCQPFCRSRYVTFFFVCLSSFLLVPFALFCSFLALLLAQEPSCRNTTSGPVCYRSVANTGFTQTDYNRLYLNRWFS